MNYSIMVPAPVVTEYFVGASATELNEFALFASRFECPVLDLPSAKLAAELLRGGVFESIRDEFGTPRQSIKVDALIIAIAVINKADRIVTNDYKQFNQLARGRILISEVPVLSDRPSGLPASDSNVQQPNLNLGPDQDEPEIADPDQGQS